MKNKYPLQQGKKTWEQLEKIHLLGYSYATIFSDFIDACLFALLSLTENMQYVDILERLQENKLTGVYEDQYMQLVEKYKENKNRAKGERPIDYIANAWGVLQQETHEAQQDILGEIFMTQISLGEHGQFFTPSPIADMMAYMVGETGKTVSDPCCGSGRFFISMAKLNKEAHFYGVDLSPICAKMTVLNMWLFDLNADIYHGNTLTMEMYHVWKIRKGGFVYESTIEEKTSLPEAVKTKLQAQAEQQQLFTFDESNE